MTIHFTYDPEKYFVNTIESNTAPDNSTTVAPDLQTGYWSKFTGKKWENEKIPETIEDIINLSVPAPVVYPADDPATQHQQVLRAIILRILSTTDKAKAVINDGVLKVVAVTEQEMLEEAKETKHSQLKSTMQSKRQALKVSYDDDEFDANEDAQANMIVLLKSFDLGATSVSIRSTTEKTHTFNKDHTQELSLLMLQAVNELYDKYWELKDQLSKCETVDAVNEIKWE